MQTDEQRQEKYNSKTIAANVALIVAATLPQQRANFADPGGMSDLVSKETQIQALLNGHASKVPTIQYPFYLCFGRELWALTRRGIAGEAFSGAAQGVRDKWNYKGFLSAPILDLIALTVFNVVTA